MIRTEMLPSYYGKLLVPTLRALESKNGQQIAWVPVSYVGVGVTLLHGHETQTVGRKLCLCPYRERSRGQIPPLAGRSSAPALSWEFGSQQRETQECPLPWADDVHLGLGF
jgi:hypothetical protein